MFILRMIFRSFSRQFRRRLLVAITICLSSAVATAMLGVVFDVGDKLNEELSAYGSNIVIEPKSDAVVADLYETVDGSDTEPTSFLKESDIQKIKTIFWAYNITNFAPKLNLHADITAGTGGDAATVPVVGTWFNTTLHLATGETSVVGVQGMRSWWTINGRWARDDADEAMIGADLADQLHIDAPGMTITLSRGNTAATVTVVGIYDSGDEENGAVYVPSATLQELSGLTDSVDEVEVKALTTPENDLARKVSRNPAAVTQEEWETWYCTAYASSIAFPISWRTLCLFRPVFLNILRHCPYGAENLLSLFRVLEFYTVFPLHKHYEFQRIYRVEAEPFPEQRSIGIYVFRLHAFEIQSFYYLLFQFFNQIFHYR